MKNVIRGFFIDARHLENMFKYLTRTTLTNVIDENFKQQIGRYICRSWLFVLFCIFTDLLEAYLRQMLQTQEFYEFMELAELKCTAEFDGALHYKWISILVIEILNISVV